MNRELVKRQSPPDLVRKLRLAEAAAAAAAPVERAGLLRKKGRVNPSWRTRWVEARPADGRLYYFRNHGDTNWRGFVECRLATAIAPAEAPPFAFRVDTPGGAHGDDWLFQAASDSERTAWMATIQRLAGGDLVSDAALPEPDDAGCVVS